MQSDNAPRVPDGYNSESARGHGRTLATRGEGRICRTNAPARDRACTPVPPPDLHGKEGVDGSSPSEGFDIKSLQIGIWCCLRWRTIKASRVRNGYTSWELAVTRGHGRRLASHRDTPRSSDEALRKIPLHTGTRDCLIGREREPLPGDRGSRPGWLQFKGNAVRRGRSKRRPVSRDGLVGEDGGGQPARTRSSRRRRGVRGRRPHLRSHHRVQRP